MKPVFTYVWLCSAQKAKSQNLGMISKDVNEERSWIWIENILSNETRTDWVEELSGRKGL